MSRTTRHKINRLDDLLASDPTIIALSMNRATLRQFIVLAGKKTCVEKKQRSYVVPDGRTLSIRVDQRIPDDDVFGETA